jgi:hypothetical protein
METYTRHHDAVRRRDPQAVIFDQILADAGVRVLSTEWPAWKLKPGDTYAVDTLKRIRTTYGDGVLSLALKVVVGAGLPVTKDLAQAVARIVRSFPLWSSRPDALSDALAQTNLDRLRREASFLDDPSGFSILLTESLARILGPGRR